MGIHCKDGSTVKGLAMSGTSACIAEAVTFPFDTAKVRLQIQSSQGVNESLKQDPTSPPILKYRGVIGTLKTMIQEEGSRSLFRGLTAGIQRQMIVATIRIGMYDTVRTFYTKHLYNESDESMQYGARILSAITTSTMACCCGQPADLVKLRFQAQARAATDSGRIYVSEAYRTIICQDGFGGLWAGLLPNIIKGGIVNISEIVCYDVIKETILKYGFEDNIGCHFTTATITGIFTTLVCSPMDVIKTRIMNAPIGHYDGMINCAAQMMKNEGPMSFYLGTNPLFIRLTAWNICMWITFEQIKRIFC